MNVKLNFYFYSMTRIYITNNLQFSAVSLSSNHIFELNFLFELMIEGTFDLCHPDASISRTFIWFMNALKNAFVIETEIYQNKFENWDKQKVRDYLIQTILRVDRIVLTFRMIKFNNKNTSEITGFQVFSFWDMYLLIKCIKAY